MPPLFILFYYYCVNIVYKCRLKIVTTYRFSRKCNFFSNILTDINTIIKIN